MHGLATAYRESAQSAGHEVRTVAVARGKEPDSFWAEVRYLAENTRGRAVRAITPKSSPPPELVITLASWVGRPTPLMFAERLTRKWGGANVWFKREDLAHTGAHKINSALGQRSVLDGRR